MFKFWKFVMLKAYSEVIALYQCMEMDNSNNNGMYSMETFWNFIVCLKYLSYS